uniref:Secreted protein n=1 Tax=Angiostrongylus cantonensis TaxID=6313 RepID=A0A0K0DFS6_ANGCA
MTVVTVMATLSLDRTVVLLYSCAVVSFRAFPCLYDAYAYRVRDGWSDNFFEHPTQHILRIVGVSLQR